MIQEIKLKPCPFCGNKNISIEEIEPHQHSGWLKELIPDLPDSKGETFIECWQCSCSIAGQTKKEAIETWNRRANDD